MQVPKDFVLTMEQKELAEKNFPLVYWFGTRGTLPTWIDHDDYFSYLTNCYIRSISTYDGEKSKVSTYVGRMLKWSRSCYLRSEYDRRGKVSSIHADDGSCSCEPPVFDDQDRKMVIDERTRLLNFLLESIGPTREKIIRMILSGATKTEIARHMSVSRQRVKQVYDKSVRLMKIFARNNNLSINSLPSEV